jgi:starch phosphorylase
MGIPIIGVGLFYRYGYFKQRINIHGMQEEEYVPSNLYYMPVKEMKSIEGDDLHVTVDIQGEPVKIKVWLVNVGRTRLFLLDTNIEENPPQYRIITDYLYDARRDVRIQQELILGFGGMKALEAMQVRPDVYHLNEGHSAFLIVQRLRHLMVDRGYSFDEAFAFIKSTTVFTTHTPVEAGNENFPAEMVGKYLKDKIEELDIPPDRILKLGMRHDPKVFWLPALAIRSARYVNGVSVIHSEVSRGMWEVLFPNNLKCEIPIMPVTNGAHYSWLSPHMQYLFERYVGPDYHLHDRNERLLKKLSAIPDQKLWEAHNRRKLEMIAFLRASMERYYAEAGYSSVKIGKLREILNPDFLTVGFARRFTAYKRPTLVLRDRERFKNILTNTDRPVQFIFSGKAHPADTDGKNMIKEIIGFAREFGVEDRVIFIENYSRDIAAHLVQGVDVWLNTPLKPYEASGTSGMKAGMNGVLNLSVMDGWWPECYNGKNGWEIKSGRLHDHSDLRDTAESNQIYDLFEEEITKLYYERDEGDTPAAWVQMMKESMYTVFRDFNINRMLDEYCRLNYLPAMENNHRLMENGGRRLKEIVANLDKIRSVWDKIHVKDLFTDIDRNEILFTNDKVTAESYVYLDDADPGLLDIELFYVQEDDGFCEAVSLDFAEKNRDKVGKYTGSITLQSSGAQSIGVRIVPADRELRALFPEFMKWKE